VAGEAGDGADIGVDGAAGVVAQAQGVEVALAERGQGSPRGAAPGRWSGHGKDATQTERAQIGTIGTTATDVRRETWWSESRGVGRQGAEGSRSASTPYYRGAV
jgi:hypothetical protein